MNFYIATLGCKVNQTESDEVRALLNSLHCSESRLFDADIVVINTCTVTAEADKKSRKLANKVLRASNSNNIFITGCSSSIFPEYYSNLSSRVVIRNKMELHNSIKQFVYANSELINNKSYAVPKRANNLRTRIGLKIQDGCNNSCSYCLVCKARGESYSISIDKILGDIDSMLMNSVPEVVLTGINLGSYNNDGLSLVDLLKSILTVLSKHEAISGFNTRIRLSSIEPMNITKDLISIIADSNGRICKHLHLPLQSGSDEILSSMKRPYSMSDYMECIYQIKDIIPDISISTDVIVGYPGESEEDFERTCRAVEKCSFSKVHIFPFSPRPYTTAFLLSEQISKNTKSRRIQQLTSIANDTRMNDYKSRFGMEEYVVLESGGVATTESYYHIKYICENLNSRMVKVKLPTYDQVIE